MHYIQKIPTWLLNLLHVASVPLTIQEYSKKLPDYLDSSLGGSENTSAWSSSKIEVLQSTRCPEQRDGVWTRGKKLSIEPGKSVGAKEEENDDTSSKDSPDTTNYQSQLKLMEIWLNLQFLE